MTNYDVAKAGVLLASKILEIKYLNIEFIGQKFFPSDKISAMFIKETFTIFFNKEWLCKSNQLDIMLTCFHEVRHAYQYLQIIKKSPTKLLEDDYLIKIWSNEFESYNQPKSENDLDYFQRSIEIDAIAFSIVCIKRFYNVDVKIPNIDLLAINERINFIFLNFH